MQLLWTRVPELICVRSPSSVNDDVRQQATDNTKEPTTRQVAPQEGLRAGEGSVECFVVPAQRSRPKSRPLRCHI